MDIQKNEASEVLDEMIKGVKALETILQICKKYSKSCESCPFWSVEAMDCCFKDAPANINICGVMTWRGVL